jgi:hypothetical protein
LLAIEEEVMAHVREGERKIITSGITGQTSRNETSRSTQFATSAKVLTVIEKAVEVCSQEGAVLKVSGSFVVVGDLHGNIYTLVRIFEEFGYPDSHFFIFLGDYVDHGTNSCEIIILLYALKIVFPNQIFLLRGIVWSESTCPSPV